MRALRDPDAFLATDLGVRHAIERLGHDGRPIAAERPSEPWRPYRAYAVQHLWGTLTAGETGDPPRTAEAGNAGSATALSPRAASR